MPESKPSWGGWFEERFQESGGFWNYFRGYVEFNAPFIRLIQSHVPEGGRILEVGAALGFLSMVLSGAGYRTTATDVDRRLMSQGEAMARKLGFDVRYAYGDLFDLPFRGYDCVVSSGVMEHFERERCVEGLRSQAKCAPLIAVAIPSRHVSTGLSEDNPIILYYNRRDLARLCKDAGLEVIQAVSFGDVARFKAVKAVIPPVLWQYVSGDLDGKHAIICRSQAWAP